MPTWAAITIVIAGAIALIAMLVLLRKGWRITEISLWPPALKITPPASNLPASGSDTFLAEDESKIGKISLKGATDTTNVTARKKSEIGDVTVERNRKK
jgi:hypothetical protein